MYDEPDEPPAERPRDPAGAAKEQADKFRMHAELAAVFEGPRKFDAQLLAGLDPELARDVQQTVGRLGNAIVTGGPLLTGPAAVEAGRVLDLPTSRGLTTNDYHIRRRPGETLIVRWLAGAEQADAFYDRLQAHFDAGLNGLLEDERQAHGWKQDAVAAAYLAALEKIEVVMAERYHRDAVRRNRATVLSTLATDEINIAYLCDHIMGVPAADVVGRPSAPPADDPSERDLAWYFKLFSLRGPGPAEGNTEERMCFFAYLQKADDDEF
jgi:hypothetical protein